MKGFALASVPQRIWELPAASGQFYRGADYNVAAWVKVEDYEGELLLVIQHEDDEGRHRALVDRAMLRAGDNSLLMSGLVNLRFTGQVHDVKVVLVGEGEQLDYRVDELFMQRTGDRACPDHKLISNY